VSRWPLTTTAAGWGPNPRLQCRQERYRSNDQDPLIAEAGAAAGPFFFDRGASFELKAEVTEELDNRRQIAHDDTDVVHPNGHEFSFLSPRTQTPARAYRPTDPAHCCREAPT
jgi:sugar/nucleoside kinase (ribokinase family)